MKKFNIDKTLLSLVHKNDVKCLLIGHHVEDENIDKRPLNKLTKDISEGLGLI